MRLKLVKGLKTYNEIEISERVEDILTNEGRGGRMAVATNRLPLFLTSNSKPINHFLLNGGGSLEILTKCPSGLYDMPVCFSDFSIIDGHRIDKGEIKVYQTEKRIECEFAVLWNYLITFNEEKFILTNGRMIAGRYIGIFEEMKRSDSVKDFCYNPPRPIIRC